MGEPVKRNPRTFCLTELWLLCWQTKFAGFLIILESSDVSSLNYETVSNEQQQPPTINVMFLSQNTNKNKLGDKSSFSSALCSSPKQKTIVFQSSSVFPYFFICLDFTSLLSSSSNNRHKYKLWWTSESLHKPKRWENIVWATKANDIWKTHYQSKDSLMGIYSHCWLFKQLQNMTFRSQVSLTKIYSNCLLLSSKVNFRGLNFRTSR